MAQAATSTPRRWQKPPAIKSPWVRYGLIAAVIAYGYWAFTFMPVNWDRVAQGLPRAMRILNTAWPPDFSRWQLLYSGILESIQMALVASLFGLLLSVVVAIMAARNIAPAFIYAIGRAIIVMARSFHPVIVAIIFVKAVGFGPLAGILTLTVYSVGFVGKLLAEAIEEIDRGQLEAIVSTGASFGKTVLYGVFPQVLPRLVGLGIYQTDSNLRASAIVGIAGAGGIGNTLSSAFRRFDYDFAFAILLVIIAVILVSEAVSGRIRSRLT
ncbi:MAG TPA: phosphonate ABC transporter, permease protein PhnE [Limnochordales bacterium]|nr:phosphonate ABC transporter, permease protein PhnE [Limnochordales bacterium]